MKNEKDNFANADQPEEPAFSEQDFEDLLFASNAVHQNERITEIARRYVGHNYTGNELTAGESLLNDDLEDRIDELQASYANAGFYDDMGAYYLAQKQVFGEQLAEMSMRHILLETLCTKDMPAKKLAIRQAYLYSYIDQYGLDPGWNSVVSELVDAEGLLLPSDDAEAVDELVRKSLQTSRKRIMETILEEAGGEEYLMITGSLQDFSHIETATHAWSAAATMYLPDPLKGLDGEYREHNRRTLQANLDRTQMTDEQKAKAYDALEWLL